MNHLIEYIFIVVISYACWMWMTLYLFATSIGGGKEAIKIITDKKLLEVIYKKTGLHIASIRVSSSPKPWAMMIGLPRHPCMILSQKLYESFNKDEIEYVLLHETGHYILAHSAKLAILYLSYLTIGFIIISNIQLPFVWIGIAVIIGLIQIQMSRIYEYEADNFAVSHMTNPKGMITATRKFEETYKHFDVIRHDEDTFLGRLIYMGIPYNERVRNAEKEMIRRS